MSPFGNVPSEGSLTVDCLYIGTDSDSKERRNVFGSSDIFDFWRKPFLVSLCHASHSLVGWKEGGCGLFKMCTDSVFWRIFYLRFGLSFVLLFCDSVIVQKVTVW